MTDRAQQLLQQTPFPRLFITGACHVFAMALRSAFPAYALVRIKQGKNDYAHIATCPECGMLLDAYGWISYQKYQDEHGEPVEVNVITESEVKSYSDFCWECEFVECVETEARAWIERHRVVFSGASKGPINGHPRIQVFGATEAGYRIVRNNFQTS